MKSTQINTKRLLRNAAIVCACICFPVAMQASPAAFDEVVTIAAGNENVAQGSEAGTHKYEADMGKKQKQQQKKRQRHRSINHVRR